MKEFIDKILQSNKTQAFPIMTHPGIEALGKTVKDAVTDGQVHFQAIKYLSENYNTVACSSIMDLTVEAEAFGATVNLPENEIPSVIGRLLCDAEAIAALKVPTLEAGRIPQYLLANKLAAAEIKDKPLFSGCIGPFSLAGRLYDMSEIMVAIYIEPDAILELLGKCTELLVNYCQALKATGTQGVVIAEPAAGLLSNDDCLAYSTDFVKQIVDAAQDDNFTVILHNCGNTGHCTQAMVVSGARALHFGNAIDMEGVLNSMIFHATLLKKEIDLELAKEVLKNIIKEIQSDVSVDFIQTSIKCGGFSASCWAGDKNDSVRFIDQYFKNRPLISRQS